MTHTALYATATRYALLEHLRNRLAMALIAAFIPTWIALAYCVIADLRVPFRLHETGQVLHPHGNELTSIAGAVNSITLIVGFMMFAATFTSGPFDRRLCMAGYRRTHLLLAKLTALTVISATVAVYATAITCAFWFPRQPLLFAATLFCASLTYGAFGIAFGALLSREVEGMFAIVMTSGLDTGLQNPVTTPGAADSSLVPFLPSYGSLQTAAAAAFSTSSVPGCLVVQLGWFAGAAAVGMLFFHRSTRRLAPPSRPGLFRRLLSGRLTPIDLLSRRPTEDVSAMGRNAVATGPAASAAAPGNRRAARPCPVSVQGTAPGVDAGPAPPPTSPCSEPKAPVCSAGLAEHRQCRAPGTEQ
ncbi:ABC transporter permease [Streptomyces violascens]|uniref:ABC transporter permease n=1 Tax=Streptomyces violascens TaxID=67381 RepID=UPI0037A28BB9